MFESARLKISVPAPAPVLKLPLKFCAIEKAPNAEFPAPVMLLIRALWPSAVLNDAGCLRIRFWGCLRVRRKCKAHQNERDEKEPAP